MPQIPFWRRKKLNELSDHEWEALCDRCGKCCTKKHTIKKGTRLNDQILEADVVLHTNVACQFLDCSSATCTVYQDRFARKSDCVDINLEILPKAVAWLPSTCAYKLLYHGHDIPDWHPLKTGNPSSTKETGHSVHGKMINEDKVEDLDDLDLVMNTKI